MEWIKFNHNTYAPHTLRECKKQLEGLKKTNLHDKQLLTNLHDMLKDSLSKLMYAYNCTKHSVTGFSPFILLLDRKWRLPIDIIWVTIKMKNHIIVTWIICKNGEIE